MFETIKTLLTELTRRRKQRASFSDNDYRVAAGALLVRLACANGGMSANKCATLHALMKDRFGLDDTTTTQLLKEAADADHHAIDLYRFTSQIARSVDDEGRRRIVEMMWEIVHAGRSIGDFEQNFIWRAADLLGVSSRERIALRRRMAARDKRLSTKLAPAKLSHVDEGLGHATNPARAHN